TIATAIRKAATSLPKDERCWVPVNFSPAGGRPEGVVSAGFAVAFGAAPAGVLGGVAASSGISAMLLTLRSTATARKRTIPPLVHLTSPVSAPVSFLYATVPSTSPFTLT